jgi:hypothetical protein
MLVASLVIVLGLLLIARATRRPTPVPTETETLDRGLVDLIKQLSNNEPTFERPAAVERHRWPKGTTSAAPVTTRADDVQLSSRLHALAPMTGFEDDAPTTIAPARYPRD